MKYRIEYRTSRYDIDEGRPRVVQNFGGNFQEFDAENDADAQTKAFTEWQKVLHMAHAHNLRSVDFVRLEQLRSSVHIALQWKPAA